MGAPGVWGTNDLGVFGSAGGMGAVVRSHRPDCQFGPAWAFYRVVHTTGGGETATRHFAGQGEAETFVRLLPSTAGARAYRDACLDAPSGVRVVSDALTPEVVDGEWWLALPRDQAIAELGLDTEEEYARVARAVEDMLAARDNRQNQGGVRVPVVLKRRRRNRLVALPPNTLTRIRLTGQGVPKRLLPHY